MRQLESAGESSTTGNKSLGRDSELVRWDLGLRFKVFFFGGGAGHLCWR